MLEGIAEIINTEKGLLKQSRHIYNDTFRPGVSIIVPTFKSKYINNIFNNYARSNYPVKELIIVLNSFELDITEYQYLASGYDDIKILKLGEKYSLGQCLNIGIDHSKYDYISRMDDDDFYGPDYLTDLMNVFNYMDAQMTGKNPVFVYFEDNKSLYLLNHINPVMGATFLFKKEVYEKVRFRNLNFREDYFFLSDCIKAGIKVYPSDKYNYVYVRHSNLQNHTFRQPSEDFIQTYDLQKILTIKDFSSFVTA